MPKALVSLVERGIFFQLLNLAASQYYILLPDYVHFQLEVIAMAVTLYIFDICTNVLSGRPEIQVYKSTDSQNWFLELEVGCFPYNTYVMMHLARFLKFCPKRPLTE